jgi:archaellum biogenesis ATPase FlaH
MRSVQRIAIDEKWQKEVAQIIDSLKSSAKKEKANSSSPNVLEIMSKLRKATSIAKVGCPSSCY